MVQLGKNTRFAMEAHVGGVAGEPAHGNHFECDVPPQALVIGPKYFAHAARADLFKYPVMPELLADRGRSGHSGLIVEFRPSTVNARDLVEGPECRGLVFVDVEEGEQASDLQQIADVFMQVHELHFPTVITHTGVVAHELADTGAVNVGYARHVEQDLGITITDQLLHDFPELSGGFPEPKLAGNVHNGNSLDCPGAGLNRHPLPPEPE